MELIKKHTCYASGATMQRFMEDGAGFAQGAFAEYYEEGGLRMTANYEKGKLHGIKEVFPKQMKYGSEYAYVMLGYYKGAPTGYALIVHKHPHDYDPAKEGAIHILERYFYHPSRGKIKASDDENRILESEIFKLERELASRPYLTEDDVGESVELFTLNNFIPVKPDDGDMPGKAGVRSDVNISLVSKKGPSIRGLADRIAESYMHQQHMEDDADMDIFWRVHTAILEILQRGTKDARAFFLSEMGVYDHSTEQREYEELQESIVYVNDYKNVEKHTPAPKVESKKEAKPAPKKKSVYDEALENINLYPSQVREGLRENFEKGKKEAEEMLRKKEAKKDDLSEVKKILLPKTNRVKGVFSFREGLSSLSPQTAGLYYQYKDLLHALNQRFYSRVINVFIIKGNIPDDYKELNHFCLKAKLKVGMYFFVTDPHGQSLSKTDRITYRNVTPAELSYLQDLAYALNYHEEMLIDASGVSKGYTLIEDEREVMKIPSVKKAKPTRVAKAKKEPIKLLPAPAKVSKAKAKKVTKAKAKKPKKVKAKKATKIISSPKNTTTMVVKKKTKKPRKSVITKAVARNKKLNKKRVLSTKKRVVKKTRALVKDKKLEQVLVSTMNKGFAKLAKTLSGVKSKKTRVRKCKTAKRK